MAGVGLLRGAVTRGPHMAQLLLRTDSKGRGFGCPFAQQLQLGTPLTLGVSAVRLDTGSQRRDIGCLAHGALSILHSNARFASSRPPRGWQVFNHSVG
jgi:hypothetical protein